MLIFASQMSGFSKALEFLFAPNFEKLTADGVLEAVGHSFFSLSLGVGAMITYGSYLKEDNAKLVSTGIWICFLDTLVALVAGIIIFSVTFSFDYSPASGPGLMFVTMPLLFNQITGGYFLLIAFFTLVAFAALTSSMAILEVITSFVCEKWEMPRKRANLLIGLAVWFVGVLCALSFNVLDGVFNFFDVFDKLTSSLFMPLAGIFTALFMGWVLGEAPLIKELAKRSNIVSKTFLWILRILTPALVFVILLGALYDWIG